MTSEKNPYAMITKGDSKPKKEIHRMHHERTTDGKIIHTHVHHRPEHHPDERHVSNNMSEMHDHIEKHFGSPSDGEGAEGAAPVTAAPSPMASPAEAAPAPAME